MKNIKAVALDVDGVITDGTFVWGTNGEEYKQFSFMDIMGISLASKAGLKFIILSGEDNVLIDRFTKKMNVADVYKGCKDKASALLSFSEKHKISLAEICFMGDDVNDIAAMELVGYSAAPANAHDRVKAIADYVTKNSGGKGAVRELLDLILSEKNEL